MFTDWFGKAYPYLSDEMWKHKREWPHGGATSSILEYCIAAALLNGIPIEHFNDLQMARLD